MESEINYSDPHFHRATVLIEVHFRDRNNFMGHYYC